MRHQAGRFGKPAPLLGIARQPDEAGPHARLRRVQRADDHPDGGFDFPAIELAAVNRGSDEMGDRPVRHQLAALPNDFRGDSFAQLALRRVFRSGLDAAGPAIRRLDEPGVVRPVPERKTENPHRADAGERRAEIAGEIALALLDDGVDELVGQRQQPRREFADRMGRKQGVYGVRDRGHVAEDRAQGGGDRDAEPRHSGRAGKPRASGPVRSSPSGPNLASGYGWFDAQPDPVARSEGLMIAGRAHDVGIARHDPETAKLIRMRNRAMGAHVTCRSP